MSFSPHEYQKRAAAFILGNMHSGLFLDPGLGKTSITLMCLSGLKRCGLPHRALIIAPLRVVYGVWPEEIRKWPCFRHLSLSIVHGDARARRQALARDADIYITNPENVPWLFAQPELPKWDVLVIDESTKFKNRSSKRFRALRWALNRFTRRIILTGTPSPNSLLELWGQIFILDQGRRLGAFTDYQHNYFAANDWNQYRWEVKKGCRDLIGEKIKDITLRLDAKDLLNMPPLMVNDIPVQLSEKTMQSYKKFEDQLYSEIESLERSGHPVTLAADSAGVKYGMLRQLASGGIYEHAGAGGTALHDAKLEALADLVEELNGKPLIVCYHYRHELARLKAAYPKAKALNGECSPKEADKIQKEWNAGDIPILLAQPMSMGHGLNLQQGGRNLCWFTLTDSLEIYQQANARIYRQGQTGPVVIHRLLSVGTIDTLIARRLEDRDLQQQSLLELIKLSRGQHGLDTEISTTVRGQTVSASPMGTEQ